MSTVIVLTPIIIANWAAIAAAVAAAVKLEGFIPVQAANFEESRVAETAREEIEVDNSEILETAAGRGEQIVVEREGLRAVFTRDARGALRRLHGGPGTLQGRAAKDRPGVDRRCDPTVRV